MKWEYTMHTFMAGAAKDMVMVPETRRLTKLIYNPADPSAVDDKVTGIINGLGNEGWEAFAANYAGAVMQMFFKRPKMDH